MKTIKEKETELNWLNDSLLKLHFDKVQKRATSAVEKISAGSILPQVELTALYLIRDHYRDNVMNDSQDVSDLENFKIYHHAIYEYENS